MPAVAKNRARQAILRSSIAVAAAIVPFLIRQGIAWRFGIDLPPVPFFGPSIILVALNLGFASGLVTVVTGTILMSLFVSPQMAELRPELGASTASRVAFLFLATAMSYLVDRYRKTLRRVAQLEGECELKASEDRFQAVLRDSRDVVYRINLKTGRYEFVSPSVVTVMGFTEAEILQMTREEVLERVHPDDRAHLMAELKRSESEARLEIEYRQRSRDGHYRWLSNAVTTLLDEAGAPLYREGTIRDVSDQRKAQEALLRSSALASAGRLSAAIAHEINNPLTAVTNLLYLAQSHPDLPEAARGYLERADAELQRIAHIARRALGFYRENEAPARVAIDTLLESSIELFRHRIAASQVKIIRDAAPGLELTAFGGELRQVFTNLVSNSLDAVGEQGTLRIRAQKRLDTGSGQARIRVTVADSGGGIAPELRAQVFEPFFTTKGAVGTGLGLWVTARLVEKNGGRIRMRSSVSESRHGTVFVVDLPA